jgi:hypothetical protein
MSLGIAPFITARGHDLETSAKSFKTSTSGFLGVEAAPSGGFVGFPYIAPRGCLRLLDIQ